jgi:adenylate cyclase
LLAEFASVVDAVRCAVEMQRGMAERNTALAATELIEFRIGINLGDVIAEGDDIFGDGVNVAARLEGLAAPGNVCISGTVHDHIRDRLPYVFDDLGEQSVKNIARPVRAYALHPGATADPPVPAAPLAEPARRRRSPFTAIAGVATALMVLAVVAWRVWPVPILSTAATTVASPVAPLSKPLVAPRLSIVVLPFTNLSDDPKQQYFADAITEDLTTDLSRIPDMLVISRNTAFAYKDKPVDTKQIGHELGIRYVLEGSVQRSGNLVRINAQLIDADTDTHLWAERFDRDTGNLMALQDEVTNRIAVALNIALTDAEAAQPNDHPDALDYVLRGRAAVAKGPANTAEAISLFERALVLDPRSVEAQTRLAGMLLSRVNTGMTDSAAIDVARADALVGQALARSPRNWYAHLVKGQVLRAQHRCEDAIPEYQTALALNRNGVAALLTLAYCKLHTGSIDEVIPLLEQAIRLSPRDPGVGYFYGTIGFAYLLQSRIDEAIFWLEKARSALPGLPHAYLTAAYALKGETERAAAELAAARRLRGDNFNIARLKATEYYGVPKFRTLFETTYLAGLRKAGVPEE